MLRLKALTDNPSTVMIHTYMSFYVLTFDAGKLDYFMVHSDASWLSATPAGTQNTSKLQISIFHGISLVDSLMTTITNLLPRV